METEFRMDARPRRRPAVVGAVPSAPSPAAAWRRPNAPIGSLRPHCRDFAAPTRRSAGVPGDGTQCPAGSPLGTLLSPAAMQGVSGHAFSCSTRKSVLPPAAGVTVDSRAAGRAPCPCRTPGPLHCVSGLKFGRYLTVRNVTTLY